VSGEADWETLDQEVTSCTRCPRLVQYREMIARIKKREFSSWNYWGKPLTGFGDRTGKLMVVGLAPAAHGGNRTGRMFTGDSSGEWLTRALYRAGLANQPTSQSRDDGLVLKGVYVTAVVRCAPPGNKPTPQELANCRPFLKREIELMKPKAFLALGGIALKGLGEALGVKGLRFEHGATIKVGEKWIVVSYHPSRQNTNTGKLTEAMLDDVVKKAKELAGIA